MSLSLKEALDKLTEILRCIQYAGTAQTKEDLMGLLTNLIVLVGEALVERDSAAEKLQSYNVQLWISHIVGHLECPDCSTSIPMDFFVGSKGVAGKPIAAGSKDELIELLEFPPITKEDIARYPIPDFMPDL